MRQHLVAVESEHVIELLTCFDERGVSGEKVAGHTAAKVREYLDIEMDMQRCNEKALEVRVGGWQVIENLQKRTIRV